MDGKPVRRSREPQDPERVEVAGDRQKRERGPQAAVILAAPVPKPAPQPIWDEDGGKRDRDDQTEDRERERPNDIGQGAQHADYETVNSILKSVEGQVAGWFDTGLIADVEDVTPKDVDNALAMWSVVTAREIAWDHAQVIWNLRRMPELERAYIDVLARTTELSGCAMLV